MVGFGLGIQGLGHRRRASSWTLLAADPHQKDFLETVLLVKICQSFDSKSWEDLVSMLYSAPGAR